MRRQAAGEVRQKYRYDPGGFRRLMAELVHVCHSAADLAPKPFHGSTSGLKPPRYKTGGSPPGPDGALGQACLRDTRIHDGRRNQPVQRFGGADAVKEHSRLKPADGKRAAEVCAGRSVSAVAAGVRVPSGEPL